MLNKDLLTKPHSNCSFSVTMVLAMFLGIFGVHRIYVGKKGLGIAMLSTAIICITSFSILFLATFLSYDGGSITSTSSMPEWAVFVATLGIASYIGMGVSAIIAFVDIIMLGMQEFKDKKGLAIAPSVSECSNRSYLVTLLFVLFLGFLGVHRFYAGRYLSGVLMLITLGGLGIWVLIDMVLIAVVEFKDSDGLPIAYN